MRRRHTAILLVLMISCMSSWGTVGFISSESMSDVLLLQRSLNLSEADILNFADFSRKEGIPIVLFDNSYRTVEVELSEAVHCIDVGSGNSWIEAKTIHRIQQCVYRYIVIEPNNTIREKEFYLDEPDITIYKASLDAAVELLEEAYPRVSQTCLPAYYSGDSEAWESHYYWHRESPREWSAVDDDHDHYTMELNLKRDVWRSILDFQTTKKYWDSEWRMSHAIDQDDYKASYSTRVGPFVAQRWLKYDESNIGIYDWGPTTSVGSWSYSIGQQVQAGSGGAVYQLSIANSWTKSDVTILDDTSEYYDIAEWTETFTGPTYFWYPALIEPCDASHHTYISYRGVEWQNSRQDGGMYGSQSYDGDFIYDTNFQFLLFVLRWTRYTYTISYTDSVSYTSGFW